MADIQITKIAAAQRQLDAAIRILFSGEDILAVHTVAAAAHRVVADLTKARAPTELEELRIGPLKERYKNLLGMIPTEAVIRRELPRYMRQFSEWMNRPANFLKHADRDANASLGQDDLGTDGLILEAVVLYGSLGLDLTPEMQAFGRWHLAVYPHEKGDEVETAAGSVHSLSRSDQLDFGNFLIELSREGKL